MNEKMGSSRVTGFLRAERRTVVNGKGEEVLLTGWGLVTGCFLKAICGLLTATAGLTVLRGLRLLSVNWRELNTLSSSGLPSATATLPERISG